MKKLLIAICAALATACAAYAEIPAGYYNSLNGKKDAELKTAVYEIIHNLTRISSYNDLPQYFQTTDVYPELYNGRRRWWDMYSDIPLYAPSFSGLNREHSFPKSWWGGLTNVNAYTDLNHLYPSEMAANSAKSNYPLGTVDMRYTPNFDNGVVKVGYAVAGQGGGARYVFEPNDEYKGDFARTYFYMVTCYQDYTWTQQYMWMLQQNTYPTLNEWSVALLLEWSRQDEVSEKEINRNDAVYTFQKNRNPFIDIPALAEYIWGNKKGEPFDMSEVGGGGDVAGDPVLYSPVADMSLDFGQVAVGKSSTARLFFRGENLTSDLSLRVYSGNKEFFSIPSSKIAANLVNAPDGYWLTVTYTPTELGEHSSRLLVYDGGLTGNFGVNLVGECLPTPSLGVCTATAATDITADSYTANWTAPAADVVDYFIVTRTKYSGGNMVQEELLSEQNSLVVEGFGDSDSESYYVQSSRLGFTSEPSNVVFVEHSGITGVEADQPLLVVAHEGFVRFMCGAPHTGVRIYDALGREVMALPAIDNNDELALPRGVYVITTDQSRTPARVAVR